ncbi:hypothetical protein M3212_09505 [Alkalihalobacillus oceani]|uniref:hypothetical protein n=1 Tax=Halalkalibacter oceani TaxID=1653776 RepID=UPI00203A8CC7|nr:hypothetical protein [Halalkalibacter oceani]MCM3761019.1 hypothetical protein [Halalkalibacter oceani]
MTEAVEDATVEVKDSKGNVVEVVAQNLAKGATNAQFDFVKAVTNDDRTGVWTVNGVEYSFDELELVADIVAASAAPVNQVQLYNLLTEAGIQNLNADFIGQYATAIDTATTTPEWAVDVQEIIDQVNKDNADDAAEAAVVKAVADATNQIQLLAALEANFDRVNKDWIAQYAAQDVDVDTVADIPMLNLDSANYFGETNGTDVARIQAAIDTVNNDAIFDPVTGLDTVADTSAKQAEVTSLIQKWIEDDVAPATAKADAIEASKIKEAAFRVAEATTENSVYNALVAYANITPDATLKTSELNTNLKAFYKGALDTVTKATLVADIQGGTDDIKNDIVVQADGDAVEDAVVKIGAAATTLAGTDNATNRAALKAELQKLANYTSHKTAAADKFLMSTIDDSRLVDYARELDADVIGTGNSVADVQGSISTVNNTASLSVALDTINDTASTAVQVRSALFDIAEANENHAEAGVTAVVTDFYNLSSQARLEVAELVIENRPGGGYADLDAILKTSAATYGDGALKDEIANHGTKVGEFNAIGDLNANPTTNATKAHLDTYGYAPYVALSTAQKLAVADHINGLTKDVAGVATPLDFSGDDEVKTLKAANDIIDAAIAAIQ